jgi:hypothetical protein
MCTVLLPPGVNPIALNKYIIIKQIKQDGMGGKLHAEENQHMKIILKIRK